MISDEMRELATDGIGYFRWERHRAGAEYLRLNNSAPTWLEELVYAAHRDRKILPDDWRYRFTYDSLAMIVAGDRESTSGDLLARPREKQNLLQLVEWIGSSTLRLEYCDRVLVGSQGDMTASDMLATAQDIERREVLEIVWGIVAQQVSST